MNIVGVTKQTSKYVCKGELHLHHLSSVENVSFKLRKEINCREEAECSVKCILIVKLLNPTRIART